MIKRCDQTDICFTELLICKNWHVKMEDHSNGIMDMENRHLKKLKALITRPDVGSS